MGSSPPQTSPSSEAVEPASSLRAGAGWRAWLGKARSDLLRDVPLDPVAEETFQRERLETNLDRIRMFTPLAVLVHVVWIALYLPRGSLDERLFSFRVAVCAIHGAALAVLTVGWLLRWLAARLSPLRALRELAPDAIALVYLLFGAAISVVAQWLNGNQNSYVITVLLMCTGLRLRNGRAALFLAIALAAYVGGVQAIQVHGLVRIAAVGPAAAVTVLAWVLSRANSQAARRAVAARLTIVAQREELAEHKRVLEEMNKELGERVEARAGEIARLNTELRVNVVDRSRELLRALRDITPPPSHEELQPKTIFADRVEVQRLLGRGGMGEVYLGDDRMTGRRVALKLMRRDLSVSRESLARFVAEAAAAAAVDHAAVVRTLHVGVAQDGRFYQLIEYVEGWTLEHELRHGRLAHPDACRLGAVIAGALAAAHARGVVHRDVKPSNVMLTDAPPGLRLMDFGAAKFVHAEDGVRMTAENHVVGTPLYMAPEQVISPRDVAAPADVYALGAVLFEMLVGETPFAAEAVRSLLIAKAAGPAPRLGDLVQVPARLAALVDAALSRDPAARPLAAEMATALDELADAEGAPPAERARTHVRVLGAETTLTMAP